MREYRAKDPERYRQYLRDYRKRNKKKCRSWDLKNRYGITVAEREAMWEAQRGACACCGQNMLPHGQETRSRCLDHDHITGKIRALLCTGCNIAIAHLGESPTRCEQAAAYLRKHGKV